MRGASPNRMIDKVPFNPRHDQIGKSVYLRFGEFTAFGQMMPFFDASPAACGGGMLGGEYWMTTPRCLFAIIFRLGRTYPLTQHFMRMPIDGRFTFDPSVGTVFVGQHEFGTKCRMLQTRQRFSNPLLFIIGRHAS